MSIESMMPSNNLILCCPLHLQPQSFPASGSFPMSQPFASSGQSIRVSVSASDLPMNIHCWFPLGLTALVFLLFKEYSSCYLKDDIETPRASRESKWSWHHGFHWWRRRKWQPTPVLLPGEFHGWRSPGRLQSMGSLRVGHDWATSLSLFAFRHWRRKWQPIPVFLPGESQGWGSLVGCHLWGRTESDTTEAT